MSASCGSDDLAGPVPDDRERSVDVPLQVDRPGNRGWALFARVAPSGPNRAALNGRTTVRTAGSADVALSSASVWPLMPETGISLARMLRAMVVLWSYL